MCALHAYRYTKCACMGMHELYMSCMHVYHIGIHVHEYVYVVWMDVCIGALNACVPYTYPYMCTRVHGLCT